jgi:hypothetical protein
MTFRTLESHLACLIGGLAAGVLIMWGAGQNKDLKAAVKTAAVVQKDTAKSINRSNALEKDLLSHDAKTDVAVAKAKSTLRKTPWVMVEKCQPEGYTIKPQFGPDDYWTAYRDGRNSVLDPNRIRPGAGLHSPVEPIELSAAAAP